MFVSVARARVGLLLAVVTLAIAAGTGVVVAHDGPAAVPGGDAGTSQSGGGGAHPASGDGAPYPSVTGGGESEFGLAGVDSHAQTSTPRNNSTVQHENPATTSGQGDTGRLLAWLSGRLTGGLEGSLLELSQGEYELAKQLVGPEWRERLGQYVDVAGETDAETDDQASEAFEEAGRTQRNYTDSVQDFRRTVERLEQARENGNQSAVRRYARRLVRLGDQVEQYNRTLANRLKTIGNLTGSDTSRGIVTLREITRNITETESEIAERTFIRTELTVRTNRSEISFRRPVRLSGTLRAENGSAIEGRDVTISIWRRNYTVRTGTDGTFDLTYRPVAIPVDRQTFSISYRPRPTSPYLGNSTSVPATIRQVEAELGLDGVASSYRFGDEVDLQAQLTVDGRVVPRVPITLSLAGDQLATATTGDDGTAALEASVPAAIPTGERSLRVTSPWEGRAVAPAAAGEAVAIQETATRLDLNASFDPDVGLVINGTLRTEAGARVAGMPVTLSLPGGDNLSLETAPSGEFGTEIPVSTLRERALNGPVELVAAFSGEGTNLAPSSESETVELPREWPRGENRTESGDGGSASEGGGGADGGGPGSENPGGDTRIESLLPVIAGGVLLLLLASAILLAWRRYSDAEGEPADPSQTGPTGSFVTTPGTPAIQLERARELLASEDQEGSVADAYAAVRQQISQTHELPAHLTHREFEAACYDVIEDEDFGHLSTLAGAYEQLVFAADLSTERAQEAVAAAEALLN